MNQNIDYIRFIHFSGYCMKHFIISSIKIAGLVFAPPLQTFDIEIQFYDEQRTSRGIFHFSLVFFHLRTHINHGQGWFLPSWIVVLYTFGLGLLGRQLQWIKRIFYLKYGTIFQRQKYIIFSFTSVPLEGLRPQRVEFYTCD